ncbi:MAG: efflux RND transporter permease subunit, partial [Dehalococcoidia bacterium]|nr:efflux RND transporter permease subunit [Dehalococcoidia bacterium]
QLSAIPIVSRTGQVTLGQVTQIRQGRAPTQIQRVDRKRAVQVSAAVAGRPVGDVAKDLRVKLETVTLPPNYRYEVRGSVQQLNATLAALSAALALSVLLVYMTLVALYESFLYPLAIMFALPLSAVGAFSALMLTGNTINIFSMIGLIALMGLVEKNGILLVDYANTLRSRGQSRRDALANAGSTRLRPIVMTSATVVAAMAPLTLKLEAGAESRAPMAVVIIGGVVSSTVLTLFVVPVIYTLLDDLQERFNIKGTFRWPWNRKAEAEPATGGPLAPAHGAPLPAPPAGATASAATTLHAVADPDAGG